jgi:DNA ligase (NAD+)
MDIEGLGESVAGQLTARGFVKKIDDIYDLSLKDLMGLELFGEKRAANLIKAIKDSKECRFDKFIYALGIRQAGSRAAEILAGKYKNIDNFLRAKYDELESIDEIGPVRAKFIILFLKRNSGLIKDMLSKGVSPGYQKTIEVLDGLKIVFTGKLEQFTRKEAKEAVKSMGGRIVSNVSSNTDILVRGDNPGSKLRLARGKGVKIIDESDFLKMLKRES